MFISEMKKTSNVCRRFNCHLKKDTNMIKSTPIISRKVRLLFLNDLFRRIVEIKSKLSRTELTENKEHLV
jgi:hypothetical protein